MRKLLLFLLLIFPFTTNATHIRGGEITYEWISGYTYKIYVVVYDNNSTGIDSLLELNYGDGTLDTIPLISAACYNGVCKCIYFTHHTYSGPGTYDISCALNNWIINIQNVQNSVNVGYQNSATLIIDPFFSNGNSSVTYGSDHWEVSINSGSLFHNPMTVDPDGDSLVYSLIPCGGMQLGTIYNFPEVIAGGTVQLDQTGTFQYNNLGFSGTFAVNLRVEEWKQGIFRGVSHHQMVFDWVISSIEDITEPETVFYSQTENEININSEELLESVKVFDITGKLLYSLTVINTNSLVIPVAAELFIIETVTVDGRISSRKFVGR